MKTSTPVYSVPGLLVIRQTVAERAFGRVDALAFAGGLFVLAAVCLPLLASTSRQSDQVICQNNLRRIGIAFQAWGTDHEDKRPWFVPTAEGGSKGHLLVNNAYLHYTFLSNHLSPRLLVDPADSRKQIAQSWHGSPDNFQNLGNNAVSYMVGVHAATPADATEILLSDRHLAFNGFDSCSAGFAAVGRLESGPQFLGWTNGLHGIAGNLLLNDGRTEFVSQRQLKELLPTPFFQNYPAHFLTPF
jgi:hypothetical protein